MSELTTQPPASPSSVSPSSSPSPSSEVQSGLEGVVAFATEIAEPDREGGALRYNTGEKLLNPYFVVYGPTDRDWLALLR